MWEYFVKCVLVIKAILICFCWWINLIFVVLCFWRIGFGRRGGEVYFTWIFFYCARDQFPDEELSMVTSWLPTEWLVLIEVKTLLRRAGYSLVRSLDLVMGKFVFLCLDLDCGIIIIAIKFRSLQAVCNKTAH